MYELVQAGPCSYYIDCPSKIGVWLMEGNEVCLIDSGSDKDAGRKVRQILDKNGWKLSAILNTHSNADHIGGNRYLQAQTGCLIFANGIESAFTRYPILSPSFLYGGRPFRDLRSKFLLAQESDVLDFSDARFPKEIEVIPLPGHYFDMTGFRTPDGTVFLADCLCSAETLSKYGVTFLYDVERYLETLDLVEKMDALFFVPSHAGACSDIAPLARLNREKVLEVSDFLLSLCKTPLSFEEILRRVFERYGLSMTLEQHTLVGSTVRSYLSWMKDSGAISAAVENNTLLWQKTDG